VSVFKKATTLPVTATTPIFWNELPPTAGPLWQATQPLSLNNL
jgi:hypothetical protein